MMPSEVTLDDAIKMLQWAVSVKGSEYVNRPPQGKGSCAMWDAKIDIFGHVHDRQPSCIVGHVFSEMGILHMVRQSSGVAAAQFDLNFLDDGFSPAVYEVLKRAQLGQDAGLTWGDVLAEAELTAKDFGWEPVMVADVELPVLVS